MSGIPGLFALAQPATTEGTPAAQLAAARQKLFTADGTDPSALAALWCVGVYDVSVYAHQALAKKGLLSLPARYMLAYSSTPEGLQRCEALYVQVHDVAMATTASGTGTSPPLLQPHQYLRHPLKLNLKSETKNIGKKHFPGKRSKQLRLVINF